MSQNPEQPPKVPWGQRPMKTRDYILWIGGPVVLAVILIGAAIFSISRRPAAPETAESTRAAVAQPGGSGTTETGEAAAEVAAPPPLAVLPDPPYPLDNPYSEAKAALGQMLYFDTRFSGDGSLSCNSCHPASDGSWAVSSPISFGYPGSTHWRNSQSIINVAYYSKLNWDGSQTSLEKQNNGAWGGAVAGNVDSGMAEERLAQIPVYVEMFKEVFGTEYPLYSDALLAVATFQRTITSRNVPFDAFLSGDETAISDAAKRGYDLFTGQANCLACHNGALISDDSYHNTGVPTYPGFATNALEQITFRFQHWSKGVSEDLYNTATEDLGLYYVTKLDSDKGKFRTPGLRDSCYTAPYMHNGAFTTLADVVAFYNQGGGSHPNKDPLLQPLNLTDAEQADLVAFLESLCGDPIVMSAPELPPYEVWPMGGN